MRKLTILLSLMLIPALLLTACAAPPAPGGQPQSAWC